MGDVSLGTIETGDFDATEDGWLQDCGRLLIEGHFEVLGDVDRVALIADKN